MSGDLISMKTRQVFREHLVGWTLRTISDEFDAARVVCDFEYQPPVSGQRRALIEQYYHSVNWTDWRDVKKILQVYENVMQSAIEFESTLTMESSSQVKNAMSLTIKRMTESLRRDGFHYADGKIASGAGMPSLNDIKEAAAQFDAKHLADQIRRIEQSIDTDPALAIGTAKELIETCCRTILSERGKNVVGNPDIPALTKQTLKELNLVPEDISDRVKGSEAIKRLLSNLATIGQGLAEIRNLYGTGHGKDGTSRPIKSRHAKLAVGAASTLAVFLFETHKDTK